jgi:SAM-dependent methyltransferase
LNLLSKNKSHLTAIGRKALPVPTRWLLDHNLLRGKVLDYGCGRCHKVNNNYFVCDGYDPYPFPQTDLITVGETWYDTIICNYVLCVTPAAERMPILKDIQNNLAKYGVAFISVRNDKPTMGWGFTKRGTYQGRASRLRLPLVKECAAFRIYLLTKQTVLE